MVAYTFNLAPGKQRQEGICELEASILYVASSTSRTVQLRLYGKPLPQKKKTHLLDRIHLAPDSLHNKYGRLPSFI